MVGMAKSHFMQDNYYFSDAWKLLREKVIKRDNNTCTRCGKKIEGKQFTYSNKLVVHHILDRNRGGKDEEENLTTLCGSCHNSLHPEARREARLKSKHQ